MSQLPQTIGDHGTLSYETLRPWDLGTKRPWDQARPRTTVDSIFSLVSSVSRSLRSLRSLWSLWSLGVVAGLSPLEPTPPKRKKRDAASATSPYLISEHYSQHSTYQTIRASNRRPSHPHHQCLARCMTST